jgi:hypothetical protein
MKGEKTIEKLINKIAITSKSWLDVVHLCGNQTAYTDRMIEQILSLSDELKQNYEKMFKNV